MGQLLINTLARRKLLRRDYTGEPSYHGPPVPATPVKTNPVNVGLCFYGAAAIVLLIPLALLVGGGINNREDLMWYGTLAFIPCLPLSIVSWIIGLLARL